MQKRTEIENIVEEYKGKIPSFVSVPFDEVVARENNLIGALLITSGQFKDCTAIIKTIEFNGPNLAIDYVMLDKDDNQIGDEANDTIGNLVQYFLALEALRVIREEEMNDEG